MERTGATCDRNEWNFLFELSFPAVDFKLFIKFTLRGIQYYHSIVCCVSLHDILGDNDEI